MEMPVQVKGDKMAPPQVSAEILRKMKKTEDYLNEDVTQAVILYLHTLMMRKGRLLKMLVKLQALKLKGLSTSQRLRH